jgi:hypothetical protein
VSTHAKRGAAPFAVILYLNWPVSEGNNPGIFQTVNNIARAQQAYPELDVRIISGTYKAPTIGDIRRDLWDIALNTLWKDDKLSVINAVGMNHDIDLEKLSRHYVANVQRHYQAANDPARRVMFPHLAYTQTKHAYSPSHPNVSRAVYWHDFLVRQQGTGFEAGIVMPLARYALDGGFKPSSITHETSHFTKWALRTSDIEVVKGTSLQTSPRRYLARLAEHGYGGVWTDESFTSRDECRTFTDYEDMSHGQVIEIVQDNLMNALGHVITGQLLTRIGRRNAERIFNGKMDNSTLAELKQQTVQRVKRTGKMVDLVLQNVIESPMGATFAQCHVFNENRLNTSFEELVAGWRP